MGGVGERVKSRIQMRGGWGRSGDGSPWVMGMAEG